MKLKKIIRELIIYFYFFTTAVSTFIATFYDDMLFDIKTGESILKYGFDPIDKFSCIHDLIYMYPHWLYDIVLYLIENYFKSIGVFIFFGLITALLMYLFYKSYEKIFKNKIVAVLLSIFNAYLMCLFITNRVQLVTYVLFFIEVKLLDKLYETGNKKYTYFLILESILIVNIHMPLWLLTVILMLPYVVGNILNNFRFKIFKEDKCKNSKLLYITFGLVFLSGLVSFHGIEPYLFPFKSLTSSDYDAVTEMKSIGLFDFPSLLIILVISILVTIIPKVKVKYREFFMMFGLIIMAFISYRNLAYTYLIVPYTLIKIYTNNYKIDLSKLELKNKIIKSFIYIILIILSICNLTNIQLEFCDYDKHNREIDDAITYIKENLDYKNIRLYNSFVDGPYLLYNNIKVFIDWRLEVYASVFNGGTPVIDDYMHLNILDKMEKYNLEYALFDKTNNNIKYLKNNPDYKLIYSDDNYVLYERLTNNKEISINTQNNLKQREIYINRYNPYLFSIN